ncbi:MAG TPA: DUF3108 domain-containing protein [Methylophilaceae bacterium]|nr:DUF3108 domain-containing protein [Methylophilaceae bacterium]
MHKGLTRPIPYPLLTALGVSLLLHLALLSIRLRQPVVQERHAEAILQVKLKQVRRLAQTSQAPTAPRHNPKPSPKNPSITPSPPPVQRMVEAAPETATGTTDSLISRLPAETTSHEVTEPMAQVMQQNDPQSTQSPQPVRRATILFDVVSSNASDHGKHLIQEYTSTEDGHYRIYIGSTGAGQTDLVEDTKHWDLQIDGRIGQRGLVAETYSANDDSLARQLMRGASDEEPAEPIQGHMSDGILDHFSVLYQFMFSGRQADQDHLSLTDGKHVIPYIHVDVGPERIDLPNRQEVLTQHHRFTSMQSPASLDVWIAPQMRRLPVRARFTDADGTVTELTATEVRSED